MRVPRRSRRPNRIGVQIARLVLRERRLFYRGRPVRDNVVFWESFNGNGVLCNPEALFREVRREPMLAGLRHVWSLSSGDETENRDIRAEFAGDRRVRFVAPGSAAYDRALATSRYLVSNATFGRQFSKRPEQFYVNTWHGTPLKHMGYDIGDPAFRVANVVRNFVHADVLLSPNDFTTRTLYERAHRLDGILPGRVLETGYPRIDEQFQDARGTALIRSRLEAAGLRLGRRRIVLWAPTWKGTSFVHPADDAAALFAQRDALQALLDPAEFVVLLKAHQVVHRHTAGEPAARGVLVPNDIPTNEVLAATSILVTDYSSIFVDFLSLDRPIVFYTPDIADYTDYRGLYLDPTDLPGAVVSTVGDVAAEVIRVAHGDAHPDDSTPIEARRKALRRRWAPHDDGGASRRVVDAVFTRPTDASPALARRPHVVLALPASTAAGRREEALALLHGLDLDALDVSVLLSDSRNPAYLAVQARLDPRIRQLVRQGTMDARIATRLRQRLERRRGNVEAHATVPSLARMWDDEWRRILATVRVDVAVNASGGDSFWSTLVLHSGAVTTVEWAPAEAVSALRQKLGLTST